MKAAYLRQAWCPRERFSFIFSFQSRSFAQWHMEVLCIASRTSLWWAHPQARAAELFGSPTNAQLVGSLSQIWSGLPCTVPHPAAQCHPSSLASTVLPKPPILLQMLEASDTSYGPAFKNTQVTSLIQYHPSGQRTSSLLAWASHGTYLGFNGFLHFSFSIRWVETKTSVQD